MYTQVQLPSAGCGSIGRGARPAGLANSLTIYELEGVVNSLTLISQDEDRPADMRYYFSPDHICYCCPKATGYVSYASL